jgi:hypothetical protein
MKPIDLQCGHCSRTFAVAAAQPGQEVECPHCHQSVKVPPAVREAPLVLRDPVEKPATSIEGLDFRASAREKAEDEIAARHSLFQPRRRGWGPLVLVFLTPYAIIATAIIVWLLLKLPQNRDHPLEWLIDQQPEDGGPRQIKHDLPLLDRQKIPLEKTIRVGDVVELTALRVELAPKGDALELTMRLRNISRDLRFNPIPRAYLVRDQGYTFVEFGKHRIYGGRLSYHKTQGFWANLHEFVDAAHRRPFDGVLDPGEEMVATLATSPRDEAQVRKLTDYRGPIVWRLEIRRGLVEISGKQWSAATVIGIEFDAGALLHDQRELVWNSQPTTLPTPLTSIQHR